MKNKKILGRISRKKSIRKKISGTAECPRLSVYRSNQHIYAQIIDDREGVTLLSASTMSNDFKPEDGGDKKAKAAAVGAEIAKKCLGKGVEKIVFDRNGYLYHGRVKALADAARDAGLKF